VHVVPHTHWDREWYEPFQRFRLRLVDLLDDVLARLASDPDFRFTMDGQTAAVDDYLEVRPHARADVVALVRAGRLAVGPWRVLADSFLCSGETLIRNLEIGMARATELGGAMPVGYLPDQFGHAAQLPQIMRGFGLDQACLWRGVPGAVDRHAFRWVSPDGSSVRTEYLPGGYGNASVLFSDPTATANRAREFAGRMRAWFGDLEPLAMYGTDHSAPLPTLVRQVSTVNEQDAVTAPVALRLETLAEALAGRTDAEDAPEVRGELRSHAMANLLPGVLSVRAPVKHAMAAAERMVARYAEPLSALWLPSAAGPFLDMAWLRLVDSSCHDSVTGCGADATAQQVAARIAEADQLGSAVRDRVLDALAATVPADAVFAVNPSAHRRTGLIRCVVDVPESWHAVALSLSDGSVVATQELGRPDRVLADVAMAGEDLVTAVRRRTFGQVMYGRAVRGFAIEGRAVTFDVGRRGDPGYDVEAAAGVIADAVARDPGPWRLRVVDEPRRELLAALPVPALGWASARPLHQQGVPPESAVRVVPGGLSNGIVTVEANRDGTLRVSELDGCVLDGVGRIVDGGDVGDSYNYGPPEVDTVVDTPTAVEIRHGDGGPLVGTFTIHRRYEWPVGLADHGRDTATADTEVVTTVELRAGEPFVRVAVTVHNRARDHRVRLHVPTGRPAAFSRAEGQFAVTRRGLANEGGHGERPLPTYPAYSFVDVGSAAVLLDHVTEYEVVGDGREVALTLLRAVGHISRNHHPLRAEPAGPTTPIPDAQLLGPVTTSFAVLPHDGAVTDAELMAAGEAFAQPVLARQGTGAPGGEPASRAGLSVRGDGAVCTGLRRRDGRLEARLVAYRDEPVVATVAVPGLRAASRTDLAGTVLAELPVADDACAVTLRPWEIATVTLSV